MSVVGVLWCGVEMKEGEFVYMRWRDAILENPGEAEVWGMEG